MFDSAAGMSTKNVDIPGLVSVVGVWYAVSMTKPAMTFHESYGDLPMLTLRLIRQCNVSPADYTMIVNILGIPTWDEVNEHIVSHSKTGMYRLPFGMVR